MKKSLSYKPVRHIAKGNTVRVLTGKDRGKTGEVLRVSITTRKAVVAGVNMAHRSQRARRRGEKGQIVEKPMPIHVSNLRKV